MARVSAMFSSWAVFGVSALWLALLVALYAWPASWWLDLRSVNIAGTTQGKPLLMLVERDVHRHFRGRWYATVRQWDGAGWIAYCNAAGVSNYVPESRFPRPLDLEWWTAGQCHQLPPGRYRITTSWLIETPAWVPDKTVTVDSHVFEVRP